MGSFGSLFRYLVPICVGWSGLILLYKLYLYLYTCICGALFLVNTLWSVSVEAGEALVWVQRVDRRAIASPLSAGATFLHRAHGNPQKRRKRGSRVNTGVDKYKYTKWRGAQVGAITTMADKLQIQEGKRTQGEYICFLCTKVVSQAENL